MRPPRLPRTTASRLALGYATLFALSTACLLAVVYLAVTNYAHDQHEDLIEAEWESLATEVRVSGLDAAAVRIEAWTRLDQSRPAEYLLLDETGRRRAGDLAVPALANGWSDTVALDEDGDAEPILAYAAAVPGGRLVVAAETQDLSELRNAILVAFAWAGGFAVVLAVAGGLATRLVFSRRIALFNRTTGRIVEGRLSERVPLSNADDEFDQLARKVNAMLDRIETLVENLRQVSNDVAHDLRTPLTRLRQRLEAARSSPRDSARDGEAFEQAIAESDEILATFAALLRIAEIEAGTRRSGFKQVDLSNVFSTLQEAYEAAAEDQGRTLSADIKPGISVRGDPELLTQMLSNLIENALRHTPSGSEVRMTLAGSADRVVGAVSDRGPGIPKDAREKVFRRFYRGESSRGSAGNGLGLSLVAAVADLHGIAISLSDAGPGLVVTLTFNEDQSA